MYNTLIYEVKDNVCHINLNRPKVYNAFNDELSKEFQDALKNAGKDDNVRVVVLSGEGKAFCSGQDLKDISGQDDRSLGESLHKRYNPIIKTMRKMEKPIIGKINGVAAGAGCSLALACDYIVAAKSASFIEIFINVGLVPDSGSSYFLPRVVGKQKAFELATMGNKLDAETAMKWGIVNQVAEDSELDATTQKIVDYYANAPTKAIGMIKKMLERSTHSDLEDMLEYEAQCQEIAGRSEDYKEGVDAFVNKRKPQFKGK